jgi:hypothetical protein
MATYTPPTEILPIFDSSVYVSDITPLTVGEANKKYIKYPTAQGLSTFPSGIKTDLISPLTDTSNPILFNGTTGNIYIGTSSASVSLGGTLGVVYITNLYSPVIGLSRNIYPTGTDIINLGSLSTAINIGTTSAPSSAITLGSSTSRINALGSVSMNLINPSTSTTIMNIGTTNTVEMNIGTNTSRTGILHLGDGESSTGGVHVNNGSTATGNTQIMNGTSQSGNLNLGGVDNTVNINVNRPMTINYNPSSLSTGTQIGYTYTPTVTWTNSSSSSICSQSLTQGIYQLNFSISTTGTFVDNFIYLYNTTTPSPIPSLSYRIPFIRTGASYNLCTGSSIVKMTSTQTLYLVNYSANSQTGSNGEVYITRIG